VNPKGYFDKSYTKRNKTRAFSLNKELHADLNDFIRRYVKKGKGDS